MSPYAEPRLQGMIWRWWPESNTQGAEEEEQHVPKCDANSLPDRRDGGENWTSQTENSFHLGCRYEHGQQFSSQPQIDDAPVRLGKAFPNTPTFRPALINAGGSVSRNRGRWIAYARKIVVNIPHRLLCYQLRGRMQHLMCSTGDARMSFHNLYPRSVTRGRASLELLIGKARQPSQVTRVGAGQVASVSARQLLTDGGRQGRFQGCGGRESEPGDGPGCSAAPHKAHGHWHACGEGHR